jgi:Chaperone of endosialidase
MRILSSTFAAMCAVAFVSAGASSNGAPFRSAPRAPVRVVRPEMRTAPAAHRVRFTTSCDSAGHGGYAFDSSTEFMTNYTTTEVFGESNLAAADASGTFEGISNVVCDNESVIGGGTDNVIDSGTGNAPAGALSSFIGGGGYISISQGYAFDGAGQDNSIDGYFSGVGAGYGNHISGKGSFIGAGGAADQESAGNQITGEDSFIGSGDLNTVDASEAFMGAGNLNSIHTSATYGSILGGNHNSISGEYASVLGGFDNAANGAYAIVAGGDGDSAAGTLSFAAGYKADAAHNGSFVWSDYTTGSATLKDSGINQFLVRASGGTYVYSNEAATVGVKLAPGSGMWASLSDRNAKTDIHPLDDASVLAKVEALPVSTWRYKSERGVRHAGPMAQDFYSAFGVGEDDRHITSIDEDGVALAAIKALSRQIGELRTQIGSLHGENAALKTRVAALERK